MTSIADILAWQFDPKKGQYCSTKIPDTHREPWCGFWPCELFHQLRLAYVLNFEWCWQRTKERTVWPPGNPNPHKRGIGISGQLSWIQVNVPASVRSFSSALPGYDDFPTLYGSGTRSSTRRPGYLLQFSIYIGMQTLKLPCFHSVKSPNRHVSRLARHRWNETRDKKSSRCS